MPSEPAARQALDAALAAWKNGEGPGTLADRSPKIQVTDSHRTPGQKLLGYEILGEVAADGPRGFVVRLKLDNPPEEAKVRYCVVGIDPLYVFRQEEYDMFIHWECFNPEDKEKKK